MTRLSAFLSTAVLALASATVANAQCGSGSPEATVTGEGSAYTANRGSEVVYSGGNYLEAIQTAVRSISSGERVSVMASGSIGEGSIFIDSGKIFEGCGIIDAGNRAGHGAIESHNTEGVQIPYVHMTGNPYFGLWFYGVKDLTLGEITMELSGGLGIRFERDEAANSNVKMGTIRVTGAGSHAVETWNIDQLEIGQVIAKDVGEAGLLLQTSTNVHVGLVDGDNVGTGTGYATFRMANANGRTADGGYETNVYIDKVVSRGGGRGVFCVSESGAAEIGTVDLSDNGNNSILIENCYNVKINSGAVNGGGEVRISARDEFANTRDVSITLTVEGTTVRESPCGENIQWNLSSSAGQDIC